MKTSFVRLFDYSEIVQNFEWPEDVALAVVVRDGEIVHMHPFHDGDDPAETLENIREIDDEDPAPLAVYPKVAGFPEIDMGFSEDIVLLSGIEAALNRPESELREETENFVLNYQFARDMGITMPQTAARAKTELAEKKPAEHTLSEKLLAEVKLADHSNLQDGPKAGVSSLPHGFVPYDELVDLPIRMENATYSLPAPDQAFLSFGGEGPSISLSEKDILVRPDRTGFAIPIKACTVDGDPVTNIILPVGLVPDTLAPVGFTVRPIVSRSGDLVLFTFVGAPPISKTHKVLMALFATYFVVSMAVFLVWSGDRTAGPEDTSSPVNALRSELFK